MCLFGLSYYRCVSCVYLHETHNAQTVHRLSDTTRGPFEHLHDTPHSPSGHHLTRTRCVASLESTTLVHIVHIVSIVDQPHPLRRHSIGLHLPQSYRWIFRETGSIGVCTDLIDRESGARTWCGGGRECVGTCDVWTGPASVSRIAHGEHEIWFARAEWIGCRCGVCLPTYARSISFHDAVFKLR